MTGECATVLSQTVNYRSLVMKGALLTMEIINWLVENLIYSYPEVSLIFLGPLTILVGYGAFKQTRQGFLYQKSKRQLLANLKQSVLPKTRKKQSSTR